MRLALLRGWTHSGFNIHRSQRVPPRNREDPPSRFSRSGGTSMERLAQYIIRNPFSVDKMQPNSSGDSIIYRSGMNPKIQRNFEVFSPCDFIARITQHIPDKSFQLVRYYGWYSNSRPKGDRLPEVAATERSGVATCAASGSSRRTPNPWTCPRARSSTSPRSSPAGFRPRADRRETACPQDRNGAKRSGNWRELIKKVWEADPLLCPHCQHEMRIVALIDEAAVIERILRHLGLWEAGVRVDAARDPPEPDEPVIEPWLDDPFPAYDNEPVFAEN